MYKVKALSLWMTMSFLSSFSFAQSRDLSYSASCGGQDNTVFLSFVGDILVHDAIYKSVMSGSQRFSQTWKRTDPLIQKADLSVANLEGPTALGIDRRGKDHGDVGFTYDLNIYSGTNFSFNFHPRILIDLKNSGYDLITTANNHSLDRGSIGIDRSIEAARKVGVPTVGTRMASERNAEFFKVMKVKGLNVGFVSCTEMTNGHADRNEQLLFCYKQANQVVDIIRELSERSDVDAVIVLPHWGQEYKANPDERQKSYAKRFLDAGATAIVGSHPHVLQPWEKYVTKDGRETVIMYSLGNFLAYQAGLEKKTGAVAYIGLVASSSGKAKIAGVAYTPTYRDGTEIYTVSSKHRSVLAHAALHFGTKNRLDPADSLSAQICSKAQMQ
ncbi:Capsule biosynthesis protein CapA [compost metagenome]